MTPPYVKLNLLISMRFAMKMVSTQKMNPKGYAEPLSSPLEVLSVQVLSLLQLSVLCPFLKDLRHCTEQIRAAREGLSWFKTTLCTLLLPLPRGLYFGSACWVVCLSTLL